MLNIQIKYDSFSSYPIDINIGVHGRHDEMTEEGFTYLPLDEDLAYHKVIHKVQNIASVQNNYAI